MAIDGSELLASRPVRFTPGEAAPGIHLRRGWVGPRAGLDAVVKRKIPAPAGNRTLEPRPSNFSYTSAHLHAWYSVIKQLQKHLKTAARPLRSVLTILNSLIRWLLQPAKQEDWTISSYRSSKHRFTTKHERFGPTNGTTRHHREKKFVSWGQNIWPKR